ncbi:hypothetical protein [Enterococcus sp. DIV0240d]|uniref:hypothetical protein n=1 Tax=Enterococcus sp. DIV0240d TaxID=2774717 RepID=UPI003F20BE12
MSKVLKWLEDEADRLLEECDSNHDPYKSINNSFLEGFNYAVANVEALEQPQLNPNQQIVLDWLKSTWIDRKKNCWFPFEVINSLYYQFDVAWGKGSYEEFKRIEKDKPFIKSYGELTAFEQFEVLEVFSRWALEQEAE